MTTVFVDTNVILRYLTNDIPAQSKRAEAWFQDAARGKVYIIVPQTTIVEALFHLEHWYKQEKTTSIERLRSFLSPEWIDVMVKDAVMEALEVYRRSSVDFVDLLTWTLAKHEGVGILSFDKHFDRLDPNLRIEP